MGIIPPEKLLLSKREVAVLLGIGVSTLERYMAVGWVPPPLRVGNCARWRKDEILAWIDRGCPRDK